ncbi:hypothetical protein VitviT2T_004372 [Vitis vinifera]|uniref:Early nodulin-93 n=2 Tax=Vitis vinifera TaxID=29760 RepID=A0ABY9BQ07_VITVI|eukprot:XP_002275030.1 PREDICTED: early nodulin-93 [Vitis vinifera]
MGFGSETGDISTPRKAGFPSIAESRKIVRAECVQEGVREATKAAGVAAVISTVATLGAVRYVPWVKQHINYTGRALIISAASVAAFFITADKTILECGKRNTTYDKPV